MVTFGQKHPAVKLNLEFSLLWETEIYYLIMIESSRNHSIANFKEIDILILKQGKTEAVYNFSLYF